MSMCCLCPLSMLCLIPLCSLDILIGGLHTKTVVVLWGAMLFASVIPGLIFTVCDRQRDCLKKVYDKELSLRMTDEHL